jgi:transcriptional regulator with XRE-family HTH domain
MRLPATPFLVRRARYVLGLTQSEFAEMFDVDAGTVSRWERGKLRPRPHLLKRISGIAALNSERLRASPVLKYTAPLNNLKHPLAMSEGLERAAREVGTTAQAVFRDVLNAPRYSETQYSTSGVRALEIIEQDPRWAAGSIAYAKAHFVALYFGGQWAHGLVSPIPEKNEAVVEFRQDAAQGTDGFWVELVSIESLMPKRGGRKNLEETRGARRQIPPQIC